MAQHKITFIGQNASGGYSCGGTFFPSGKGVVVTNFPEDLLRRLSNNPEFEVSETKGAAGKD